VARLARNRFWATTAQANGLHHVTNRGVGRNALFRSAADRLVFLSMLASFCLDDGLRVHCFCLMTNHFHLLVEDPRGMLSRMMLRLGTAYARFVRDSSGCRGDGHVFGDRFFSRRIGSARDYQTVVDYILLNPMRCREPLANSPASYLWSSAAIHVSEIQSSTGCTALVELFGGIEALLDTLPRPRTTRLERVRRQRFECLVAGDWLDPDVSRQGRTGVQFVTHLRMRMGETLDHLFPELVIADASPPAVSESEPPPLACPTYRGHRRSIVLDALDRIAGRLIERGEILAYALWRFGAEGERRIASTLTTSTDLAGQSIDRIRAERLTCKSTNEVLSRLEQRLTFDLRGAPWRV